MSNSLIILSVCQSQDDCSPSKKQSGWSITPTGLKHRTLGDWILDDAGPFLSSQFDDQIKLDIAPMMPARWMFPQFKLFENAVSNAKAGQLDTAREVIATIRNDDLRAWYVEAL